MNTTRFESPIAFYPQLARELGGDIEAAIFYQQVYYWSNKGSREDGFIYKTKEEIEQETTLTRRQQDRIRRKLVQKGWLETKIMKANGTPTLHYKPLISVNFFIKPEESSKSTKGTNETAPKRLMKQHQSGFSITENTTEIPEDNKLSSAAKQSNGNFKEKAGNPLINHTIQEFEKLTGFYPTDPKPRFEAHNFTRNILKLARLNGIAADELRLKKAISKYFQWVSEQSWGNDVQLLRTVRNKMPIFAYDKKMKWEGS